jgi:hypothetical protein
MFSQCGIFSSAVGRVTVKVKVHGYNKSSIEENRCEKNCKDSCSGKETCTGYG